MKKGFTLIELLGVLVILSIVLVITIPMLLNNIEDSREDSFRVNARMLAQTIMNYKNANKHFDPATLTLLNMKSTINMDPEMYETIDVEYIYRKIYVEIVGKDKWSKYKACGFHDNIVIVEKTDVATCAGIKTSNIPTSTANEPVLLAGMTPIRWTGTEWINTTRNDQEWFDYSSNQYANAKTEDGSMWVWIPRFAYQISSGYNSTTTGTIDVKFLENTSLYTADETTISQTPTYSGSSQTNYIVHPAFSFGDNEIPGFWMAKFKASAPTASDCYSTPNVANCNKTNLFPRFVPNVTTYTHIGVKESLLTSQNMARSNNPYGLSSNAVDIHLTNNLEWGAVAYLSRSEYGAHTNEIWVNPTSNNITGCTGASVASASTATCVNSYTTTNGVKGSTTHNITGVYDMRGPVWENVLGNYDNNLGSGSFRSSNEFDPKYVQIYTGTNYGYNSTVFGDAIFETSSGAVHNGSSWVGTTLGSWEGGYSYFPRTIFPFFKRGGNGQDGSLSGIFTYAEYSGAPEYLAGGNMVSNSFRSVIIPLTTRTDNLITRKIACSDKYVDIRNSKTYKTVQIGEQCWFAENLAYTTTECLNATWNDVAPFNACRVTGGVSAYSNEILYQWGAAMNSSTTVGAQGLCPNGWHIPSDADWSILETHLGMGTYQVGAGWRGTDQAVQLKALPTTWDGTNSSGFNAIPAGEREITGTLSSVGNQGRWWTSNSQSNDGLRRLINTGNNQVGSFWGSKAFGLSIRCIKND